MNVKLARRAAAGFLIALISYCGGSLDDRQTGTRLMLSQARADEAPRIFHGVGVVTGVDASSGVITIDHGAIPGLMDAMEMEYKVRPPARSDGLRKGDKIDFGVAARTYTIVEIKKIANP
jgi:Cu/Ag efflux protein CusF